MSERKKSLIMQFVILEVFLCIGAFATQPHLQRSRQCLISAPDINGSTNWSLQYNSTLSCGSSNHVN